MDFEAPLKTGFTIYSKSGCPNCRKVKELLKDKNAAFSVIDCDEYLLFEKDDFLLFIENLAGKKYTTFPMVFHNEAFLGGFAETKDFVEK